MVGGAGWRDTTNARDRRTIRVGDWSAACGLSVGLHDRRGPRLDSPLSWRLGQASGAKARSIRWQIQQWLALSCPC